VDAVGKQLAADLFALAAVGPQYIFAIARFAVGTLGDFGRDVQLQSHAPLSARIAACLGYLHTYGIDCGFESPYFTGGPQVVPNSVISAVEAVTRPAEWPSADQVKTIAHTLREGRIVEGASPVAILGALWNGVVNQSGYVHEIAALISVAIAD
jgi:hypothetical protein